MLEKLGILTKRPRLTLVCDSYSVDKGCDWSWEKAFCSGICAKNRFYGEKQIAEKTKILSEETAKILANFKEELKTVKNEEFIEIEAEHAIMGYNKFNIGFVDIAITINNGHDSDFVENCCNFSYKPFDFAGMNKSVIRVYVEIKPQVNSIGELIRQINMYRSHLTDGIWVVLTKTPNLKEILAGQNILHFEFTA